MQLIVMCLAIDYDYNGDDVVDGWDFLYYYTNDCPDPTPPPLYDPMAALSIYEVENVSDPTIPKIIIRGDQLFDSNGEFTSPALSIDKGLNIINIILKGGANRRFVFENLNPISGELALSNFLDVTIFPVPIHGNSFTINFNASASLDFTYELFDFAGNRLEGIDYSISKDHNENHVISPSVEIPSGILLNKFTFEDGSSFSVTVLKN